MSPMNPILPSILADPDADGPRLVYADYCEEKLGMPERAEFIRVQVEIARQRADLPGEHTCGRECIAAPRLWEIDDNQSCERCRALAAGLPLYRREYELLGRHGEEWSTDVARAFDCVRWGNAGVTCGVGDPLYGLGWTFRRGFIHTVRCPLASWFGDPAKGIRGHGPEVVRAQPVRGVVTDRKPLPRSDEGNHLTWFRLPNTYHNENDEDLLSDLPAGVFDLLSDGKLWLWTAGNFRTYPTSSAALDDLSAALLRWAEKPLTTPDGD
jgi:uncharacterized protein (TIGR02996 family)